MAILDLRPNCERCDRDLPPDSALALICSFECTFCTTCDQRHLHGVCPTCHGTLTPRPIRPLAGPTGGLGAHPASTERVHRPEPCPRRDRWIKTAPDP